MSYMVLARKWRPMKFEDVVAQNHITTTLKNAIIHNRLAAAYLYSGPRGVGKTTTARIFAKAINCEEGPTPTPCNECSSCKEITASRSLDVFEIDGASNRGIDEVRNLRENIRYAPSKGKHKIYIIDEVHMLTTEAFNALLKTLEEPPRKVLFIFATTEPHKVPATILSRCQRYDFRRIPMSEIIQQLQHICNAESITIDEEALFLIAKKSEGSMRDGQSLLDQVVSFCGQKVKIEELSELLGIIDHELFFECSDCITNKDVSTGLQLVDKIFIQGCDMGEFLNGLVEHFRNLLVVKATQKLDLLEGLESFGSRYKEASNSFSEADLLRLIQLAAETSYQIRRSPNSKLILEMLIVKMIKMDKSMELGELLTKISHLKNTTNPKLGNSLNTTVNFSTTKNESEAASIKQISNVVTNNSEYQINNNKSSLEKKSLSDAPVEASLENIKNHWLEIIEKVKNKKMHLGSFLNEGYPTSLEDGFLEISFGKKNGFHINTINQNRRIIENIIFEQTGLRVQIHCKKNESEEFKQILLKHKPANKPQERADENSTLQIPIVKKIIEVFNGEIIQ
ncbi:MAG: DNA polymerase III subunit gamma/tau [bacterium]